MGAGPALATDGPAHDSRLAFAAPLPGLLPGQRERFEQGRALFQQRWVVAPSAFGRWGRGPLSNAEACSDCHAGNGRGRPPATGDEPVRAAVVRLGPDAPLARPHPRYGQQLQQQGVLGEVPGEGEVHVDWLEHLARLGDGSTVVLRRPRLRFAALAYGPIAAGTPASLRVAPPLIGLGLLGAVPVPALEAVAQAQRRRGVAGRLHRLPTGPGRFGHKATRADLQEQIGAALHADLGVTSRLFPMHDCAAAQRECLDYPMPAAVEAAGGDLDALAAFLAGAAPPPRRDAAAAQEVQGERLFAQLACDACHAPSLPLPPGTGAAGDAIHPYSDLLLHDLGAGLDDGVRDGEAGPRDWRTAPLWGLGWSAAVNGNAWLLHDGRARSVEEAILWHGGEARAAREGYLGLPAAARRALAAFLASL
jgi:CxxC motif-containing protein (DUF1111 family)